MFNYLFETEIAIVHANKGVKTNSIYKTQNDRFMRHMLEFIGGEGARFYRTQNVFCGRASLFGLCFHRYTSLFHAEKKTKRQPSSKKAKQEETQTNKM